MLKLIAQNFDIYQGDDKHGGARTGAISLDHLLVAGAGGVILGHSEVNDSPEIMNSKLKTIIKHDIIKKSPDNFILTVLIGESWEEFADSAIEQVAETIADKCRVIFKDIPAEFLKNSIIGYEPKWGTRFSGRDGTPPPEPKLISACISSLRRFITNNYSGVNPFYVYGGRSTPERTLEILNDDNIDGLILGSACNTLAKTLAIAKSMEQVKGGKNKVLICNFKAYILPDPYEAYVRELKKLSDDFFIYLAPAYTDLRLVKGLL